MHALITSVLLRVAGLDALEADPQAHPPHGACSDQKNAAALAKGTPLWVRIAFGKPKSLKARSNAVTA
jgi:hypothetical protein